VSRDTLVPGACVLPTIRSFSSILLRRRRSQALMISVGLFDIALGRQDRHTAHRQNEVKVKKKKPRVLSFSTPDTGIEAGEG
jgi:hypothetical protein